MIRIDKKTGCIHIEGADPDVTEELGVAAMAVFDAAAQESEEDYRRIAQEVARGIAAAMTHIEGKHGIKPVAICPTVL